MILCGKNKKERIVDIFKIIFIGDGNKILTLAPYVPPQSISSTRTESTIFDQVYGGYRRRPGMISLNVQWIPVSNSLGTYQLSGKDVSNQKVKTVTFFGTGEMRGQQQAKVITPPSSDYTDAYLSAFASKPIPTRHIHRLSTSVFNNSAPIPLKPTSTPLFTNNVTKTSETRFISTNDIQPSNTFDKPIPSPSSSSSNRSSTYTASFIPEKSTTYEPFSRTQYSSPQSQTFTSSYSTLLRTPTSKTISTPSLSVDSQRAYTSFQTRSQPSTSSTYPTVYRSETVYENIYKPMPAYSIQTYPPSSTYTTSLSSLSTESTYKPYVPYQSVPLSSSYYNTQSSTNERIVLPTTRIEKQKDRPETLLFQPDEDIRSSRIEKPSPIFSPSPESPMTREEFKVKPEPLHIEELPVTTSEPIRILENTLSKYDSLINQISEVLASVSPLSSTVSSMSPGKSVLDYQLSSDSSPVLPHKRIETQSSGHSTSKSSSTQRTKQSHLIRDDSYDKIVTAISDLDNQLLSPSDVLKSSSTIKEDTEEENIQSNISSLNEFQTQLETAQQEEKLQTSWIPQEETKPLPSDEHQVTPIIKDAAEEIQVISTTEHQGPAATEQETKASSLKESLTSPITEDDKREETQMTSLVEDIKDDTKTSSTDEQITASITEEKKEIKTSQKQEQQVPSVLEEIKQEDEVKTMYSTEQATPFSTEEEKQIKPAQVEEQQAPSVSTEEKQEDEVKTISTAEPAISSAIQEEKEVKTAKVEQPQIPSVSEEVKEEEEIKTSSTDDQASPSITEEEKEVKPEQVEEQQVPSVSAEDKQEEEVQTLSVSQQATPLVTEEDKEVKPTQVGEQQVPSGSTEEKKEEQVKTSSTDDQASPLVSEEDKEVKLTQVEEQQVSSISAEEKQKEELKTSSADEQTSSAVTEEEKEINAAQVGEQQVPSVSAEDKQEEEVKTSSIAEQGTSSVTEEEKEVKTAQVDEQQVSSVSAEDKQEEEVRTSSTEEQRTSSVTEEEKEVKTAQVEEQQVPSVSAEEKQEDEVKTLFVGQQATPPVTEEEKEAKTAQVEEQQVPSESTEEKQEEQVKILSTDDQTSPLVTKEDKEVKPTQVEEQQVSSISTEEKQKEELKTSSADEQTSSAVTEEEKEINAAQVGEQQVPSVSAEDKQEEEVKTSSTAEQGTSSVTEEEKEVKTAQVDEQQVPSESTEEKQQEEVKTSSTDDQRTSVTEEDKEVKPTQVEEQQVPSVSKEEQKEEAVKISSTDERATSSIIEEEKKEETITSSADENQLPVASEQEKEEVKPSLSEDQQVSLPSEQEKEELKTESSNENELSSTVKEDKEDTKIVLPDQQQLSFVAQETQDVSSASPLDTSVSETKSDEQSTVETTSETAEFVQQQTGLLTNVPNDVPVTEEQKDASVDEVLTKKTGKRVTWDETVIDNEDDESLSSQSLSEESSSPAPSITAASEDTAATTTADELKTAVDQQLTFSNVTKSQITSDQTTNLPTTTESSLTISGTTDEEVIKLDSDEQQVSSSIHSEDQTNLPTTNDERVHQTDIPENQIIPSDSIERQMRSSSPLATSLIFSGSTNQQTISSDVTESQVDLSEQQIRSTSPTDTQSISTADSSTEDTYTINEVSTTTSDAISNEDIIKLAEELETKKTESKEETTIDEHKVETSSLLPTIVSPIDTLADNVSNRYISSDVYHGYLGEHQQFSQDLLDLDNDSTTKSLIASLRQTITAPMTPLIETIQSVVSSMQTTPVIHPSKAASEIVDHNEDETKLSSTVLTESAEETTEGQTQVEENEPTTDTSAKSKTVFESLREVITAPITAITETIQTAVSNLQPEKQQEVPSTTETEQVETSLVQKASTIEAEPSSNIVSSSDEKTDDHLNKEIEQPQSSLLDSIQEKVSNTITSLTETIQNVISTNVPSTETHTEDQLAVQQEKSDTQTFEQSIPTDTKREHTLADHKESYDSCIIDTTISTSSETTSLATESAVNQRDSQQIAPAESLLSEIPELPSTIKKAEESKTESIGIAPVIQHDELVSTIGSTTSEQVDTHNKQKIIPTESSLTDVPSASSDDQKTEELPVTEDKTIESSVLTSATQHADEAPTSTAIPSEHTDIIDKKEASSSEILSETNLEQKLDEHVSTETKTTLEVIRDVITHPLATISEKIQSIIPSSVSEQTEQTTTDIAETSKDQQISATEDTIVAEQKPDSIVKSENIESSETKTTLETIRDVITHPIAIITEKIQSVVSTSTNENVDQASLDTTKSSTDTSEKKESFEKQLSLETTDGTVIEQKPDSATESKTTFETLRDVITHPIATITEKIQSVISSSTTEEGSSSEQQNITDQNKDEDITLTVTDSNIKKTSDAITNPTVSVNETIEGAVSNTVDQTTSSEDKEQILTTQESKVYSQDHIQGEQEISSTKILSQISNDLTDDKTITGANQLLIDIIHDLINDTINTVIFNLNQNIIANDQINQEIFSSDSGLTSPITVLNVEDRSETSQSTINQETITNEDDFTWNNLLGEKSSEEKTNQSSDTSSHQIQSTPITETTTQQTVITLQNEDIMQRSSNELESNSTSAVTEIEKVPVKSSTDFREPSPTNTEDDSLELIHALQGHSIIHPSSPLVQTQTTTHQPSVLTSAVTKTVEQICPAPEKSSSSTTSSQITSSDRYVSYAIHEMGDSSQERLPAFPLAADIPIYKLTKTTSEENKEQQILSQPIVNVNQNLTKDDDLTELDATENLTSYSDDIHLQKLNNLPLKQRENLDASSTDEDVDDENFNEFEQNDTSNLHRIIEEMNQQSHSLSGEYEQTYQRYDVSTNSSTSTKPQTDDIYIIPGYPGLWRPSADDIDDDDHTHSSIANDADDEDEKKQSTTTTTTKTKTIVRTTHPAKLQSILQQQQHQDISVRPETIDIFNRPLNEFSFDLSESDSYKTCQSTINSSSVSKQQKQSELFDLPIPEQQEHQISPDEKIFLIRERERGVSLPVTMKIDYDNMALRLSASTPIDTQLYSTNQADLPSPSTHSEPVQKTASSSRASTPSLSSNESEHQKLPSSSWLNTINTITTTTEGPDGPLESRTTIHKSAKGPISIAECDPQGRFIVIENTSRSKSIALTGWTLRQESDNEDILTFTFPDNCLLRPNQSLKVLPKSNESERRNSDLIASLLSSWHTSSNVVTTLINAEGKDRASLTKKTLFS